MSEKTVKAKVYCPPRAGFNGFWSVQRFFPNGESEHEFTEGVVAALLAEAKEGASILTVEVVEEKKPEPKVEPKGKK